MSISFNVPAEFSHRVASVHLSVVVCIDLGAVVAGHPCLSMSPNSRCIVSMYLSLIICVYLSILQSHYDGMIPGIKSCMIPSFCGGFVCQQPGALIIGRQFCLAVHVHDR